MKTNIQILSAVDGYQEANIDGLVYDFNFNHRELSVCINNNHSTSELEDLSGIDSSEYTAFEMSELIAHDWDFDFVQMLVSDFISDHSDKLIDHLTPNYN